MSKIVTFSLFMTKAMVKERASYLFGVMAAAAMVVALSLGGTDIGFRHKLFEDILLASQGYLFVVAALFYAFMMISRDRTLGLFILPLANGMKRSRYLWAQMAAMVWIVGILFGLFVVLDVLSLLAIEGAVYGMLLWQLFLYFLSALMAAFLIVALANYVSLTNAVLYAVTLFFVGHALDELYLYAHTLQESAILQGVAAFGYYLLPNFSLFDLQGLIVNRRTLPLYEGFILPVAYFVVWSVLLYAAALVRYRKRALTVGN